MQPDSLEYQRGFAAALDAPADGAMAIYRNTVLHGAVEALRANFPVVEQIIGTEMFQQVGVDHASGCPPRRPVLAMYGARFPDWLDEQTWISDLPYLADVARVERLRTESMFAVDADALSIEHIDRCSDWQSLNLSLHPATRFDWFGGPAMRIWLAHQQPISGAINLDWQAEGALFTRPRLSVQSMLLDGACHSLLFGIRAGESVGTAAITTVHVYPDCDVGSLFASLINAGAFTASFHRNLP